MDLLSKSAASSGSRARTRSAVNAMSPASRAPDSSRCFVASTKDSRGTPRSTRLIPGHWTWRENTTMGGSEISVSPRRVRMAISASSTVTSDQKTIMVRNLKRESNCAAGTSIRKESSVRTISMWWRIWPWMSRSRAPAVKPTGASSSFCESRLFRNSAASLPLTRMTRRWERSMTTVPPSAARCSPSGLP